MQNNNHPEKKFLTYKQVADRYSVGLSTVFDWIRRGQFPEPQSIGPKFKRFDLAVLERWEAGQRTEPEGRGNEK